MTAIDAPSDEYDSEELALEDGNGVTRFDLCKSSLVAPNGGVGG